MLLVPIIRLIESQRARALTEQLLSAVRDNRAKVVVIDIHRRTGRGLESLAITWCRK
jgi:anti-anti-sigma regulatory factor